LFRTGPPKTTGRAWRRGEWQAFDDGENLRGFDEALIPRISAAREIKLGWSSCPCVYHGQGLKNHCPRQNRVRLVQNHENQLAKKIKETEKKTAKN
jgi:hypothetical protein